jgi:hypothetical protein
MSQSSVGVSADASNRRSGTRGSWVGPRIRGTARKAGKKLILRPAALLTGRQLLGRKATARLVQAWTHPNDRADVASLSVLQSAKEVHITRSGAVTLGRRVLDLDYGTLRVLQGTGENPINVGRAFAVWSHLWANYYHWVVDVLPKLCAYQQAFGEDLGDGRICYPSFQAPYEWEFLELLGVPRARVIDTRTTSPVVVHEELVVSMLPGWQLPHPAIQLVRSRLAPFAGATGPARLYISRSGRRSVINEEETVALAQSHGFTVVDDRPRSVVEQIGLFRSAEVIIAPHGAALANLTWCRPGTRVIELLPRSYQPMYFRNLCTSLGLVHAAVRDPDARGFGHWTQSASDFAVDLQVLSGILEQMDL